jgi:hypothetical protein
MGRGQPGSMVEIQQLIYAFRGLSREDDRLLAFLPYCLIFSLITDPVNNTPHPQKHLVLSAVPTILLYLQFPDCLECNEFYRTVFSAYSGRQYQMYIIYKLYCNVRAKEYIRFLQTTCCTSVFLVRICLEMG